MIEAKELQRSQLVLIVDDYEINRDVLGMILEEDYEVIYAENGREALNLMKQYRDVLSVVLLDLMMPVMSGFEVLEYVRQDRELKNIPIIVLTAEKNAELESLQLGAMDFITKPFDVTEIIKARVGRIIELNEGRQLISAAEHDALTGLYTPNFFYEYANRLYQNRSGRNLDAIVINIEQFHTINAIHGRDFGDEVLKLIGRGIREALKEGEGIASRFDADRFAIYGRLPRDYPVLLDRLQKKVSSLSANVSIRIRMGVMKGQEGVDPIQLFDRARTACTMARGDYQRPLIIYDEEIRQKELRNHRLLNDLQTAVVERHLQVYYQPKYDIHCDPPRLASAEALVRWKHPELGMIFPGDFVPLFESNGLIGVVDSFVWKEAARQIVKWREKYGITLPVSVNLSRSDVFDPTLVDRLVALIEENGLDYKSLKLEVTESAYTDNAKRVLEVIWRLRELGFEIEMDDFGSGYSSLNMLSDMPIDVLKMDMQFIRNIETSETDRRLVALILDIARYLGVDVVAEGVETEGQLEILKAGNCDLVHGYYFSRPLPPETFEKLIQREMKIEREEKQ